MTKRTKLSGIASQLQSLYYNSVAENSYLEPGDKLEYPYTEMLYAVTSLVMEIDQANTGGYLSIDLVEEKTEKLVRYTKEGRRMKGITHD